MYKIRSERDAVECIRRPHDDDHKININTHNDGITRVLVGCRCCCTTYPNTILQKGSDKRNTPRRLYATDQTRERVKHAQKKIDQFIRRSFFSLFILLSVFFFIQNRNIVKLMFTNMNKFHVNFIQSIRFQASLNI